MKSFCLSRQKLFHKYPCNVSTVFFRPHVTLIVLSPATPRQEHDNVYKDELKNVTVLLIIASMQIQTDSGNSTLLLHKPRKKYMEDS